jgi:hypothetical protein
VKDHWFHVRLVEENCGNHLLPLQRRLEALDGILGEYHNLVILREIIGTDGYTTHDDTARCLRVVARYQRLLRRHAETLGVRIYSEKPHRYLRRVKKFWKGAAAQPNGAPRKGAA